MVLFIVLVNEVSAYINVCEIEICLRLFINWTSLVTS